MRPQQSSWQLLASVFVVSTSPCLLAYVHGNSVHCFWSTTTKCRATSCSAKLWRHPAHHMFFAQSPEPAEPLTSLLDAAMSAGSMEALPWHLSALLHASLLLQCTWYMATGCAAAHSATTHCIVHKSSNLQWQGLAPNTPTTDLSDSLAMHATHIAP
jgi:hypothetical protein